MVIESHDLARLHVADIFCSKHIECTCLAGNHIAVTKLADRKRMESVLVAARIDASSCHHQEGECAVKHVEGILERMNTWKMLVGSLLLDQVCEHLCIRR